MQMDFCAPGGYLEALGISIEPTRAVIPRIQSLLGAFRSAGYRVYHTREGHRPDLSTLSGRELLRSRNNPSGKGIGDEGPLGRLLVRGEKGHDIIPELAPLPSEPIIDKPGRSAFQHTDFKLLLDNAGIRNLVICGVTTDVCVSSTMRDGSMYSISRNTHNKATFCCTIAVIISLQANCKQTIWVSIVFLCQMLPPLPRNLCTRPRWQAFAVRVGSLGPSLPPRKYWLHFEGVSLTILREFTWYNSKRIMTARSGL
jgi:nicotinamidase-related amidase